VGGVHFASAASATSAGRAESGCAFMCRAGMRGFVQGRPARRDGCDPQQGSCADAVRIGFARCAGRAETGFEFMSNARTRRYVPRWVSGATPDRRGAWTASKSGVPGVPGLAETSCAARRPARNVSSRADACRRGAVARNEQARLRGWHPCRVFRMYRHLPAPSRDVRGGAGMHRGRLGTWRDAPKRAVNCAGVSRRAAKYCVLQEREPLCPLVLAALGDVSNVSVASEMSSVSGMPRRRCPDCRTCRMCLPPPPSPCWACASYSMYRRMPLQAKVVLHHQSVSKRRALARDREGGSIVGRVAPWLLQLSCGVRPPSLNGNPGCA